MQLESVWFFLFFFLYFESSLTNQLVNCRLKHRRQTLGLLTESDMLLKPRQTKASSDKQFVLKFLGNGKYKYTYCPWKLINCLILSNLSCITRRFYPCLGLILVSLNKPVFGKYAKELLWCGLNSPPDSDEMQVCTLNSNKSELVLVCIGVNQVKQRIISTESWCGYINTVKPKQCLTVFTMTKSTFSWHYLINLNICFVMEGTQFCSISYWRVYGMASVFD